MCGGGGVVRKKLLLHFSLAISLLLFFLIWVCSNSSSRVDPIETPFSKNVAQRHHASSSSSISKNQDLLRKYFSGRRAFAFASASSSLSVSSSSVSSSFHNDPFHEAKRRVPSCPDPLHN